MTFYDELGVRPEASADEIRRAYRNLTKVHHPDLHPEGSQRRQAEQVMARLNEIWSVLGDPLRREQYDQYALRVPMPIAMAPPLPEPSRWRRVWRASAPVLIVATGFAVATGSLWYYSGGFEFGDSPAASIETEPVAPSAVPKAESAERRVARAREFLRDLAPDERIAAPVGRRSRRDSHPAASEPEGSAPAPAAEKPPELSSVVPPPQVPEPSILAKLPPELAAPVRKEESAAPQPAATSDPYEGTWLYAPSRRSEDDGDRMYSPKYIELKIQKEGGFLYGRYRGSYNVHDQPISPNVNFSFKGKPTGNLTKLAWTAPGGAAGAVELRVLSERTMQVDWKVNETGGAIDLVTGTAVLVRRDQ